MIGNFAVHLAFSTLPSENESDFIKAKRGNFTEYREGIARYMGLDENQNPERLYNPLVYHLFGTFDVVFVSLIDNYKFCQKVFDVNAAKFGSATSFQIVTGICDLDYLPQNINEYFPSDNSNEEKLATRKFVHITNFKVNNGLLIGNGNKLVNAILKKLSQELNGSEYILFKSFNWSEIVLIQFNDDLVKMQRNVVKFREYRLESIADDNLCESICKDSLYGYIDENKLFKENRDYKIRHCHIFVDTHSYSGVDYYKFNKNYNVSPYGDTFKSFIEFQVKPGHFKEFYEELKKSGIFDASNVKFKNGKTDFLVKEVEHTSFLSNYKVNKLYREKDVLKKHVRKIKTNFLLDIFPEDEQNKSLFQYEDNMGVNNFRNTLADFYTIDTNTKDLKQKFKRIGVSRQIREKILKAFSNYNNLVKDIILYGEFIELRDYLMFIKSDIEKEFQRIDSFYREILWQNNNKNNNLPNLISLEKKWTQALDIFEDAYRNRIQNNYLYEDLHEFSIDFNSAVNQINSVQDFLVKTVNNAFFPLYKDQIIVTQNEIDSKSNVINVNYNVYHYLEPCLIFTTLMKEIMNGVLHKVIGDSENQQKFDENYFKELKNNVINNIEFQLNESQILMIEDFDFFYFFSDLAKMAYTFVFDYNLYEFWAWAYFLQDSRLYKATGFPEKGYFGRELMKISLIKHTFEPNTGWVENPVPETFDIWQNYIKDVYYISDAIAKNDLFKKAKEAFLHRILGINKETRPKVHHEIYKEMYSLENYPEKFEQHTNKIHRILFENKQEDCGIDLGHIKIKSDYIQKIMTHKRSICIDFFIKENLTPFYFICAIGNATLYLLKGNIAKPKLLKRNGFPIEKYLEGEKTMFIDPCGGFFYNDRELYEKHFFYHNYVIDMLWSLAEIDKKRLFLSPNKTK